MRTVDNQIANPITGPGTYMRRGMTVARLSIAGGMFVCDKGFLYDKTPYGHMTMPERQSPYDIVSTYHRG